ncbi:MAG: CDP-diacylglycerol--glycerol-3-phosphate 3-phosphatidyltransferase [Clostridia bacterium]|nr:CDP-diacylglycerol--glycerol-3-phosphate 3-phosphatidyltransferase [Eubacteriales bacterium]MDD3867465.1 CDP-diacylglycerol--glycerol-3-phosphate 3-phosphatidyltransferase [Eubacteriales bacterium]MDD4461820.1 CDP-diacylglycerol--glycerol-3-phosphate 3-phosphatidyltransferase [Eubacteriales bacterium]NCC48471.1 CDP-diacylglycerol--glycerol-3-phosphate 3-phosphatidyltransferase [Clostridia bacterium]
MNLPNKLTIIRILLVPLILIFLIPLPQWTDGMVRWNQFILQDGRLIALCLFIIASLTDYLDGTIARKQNLVTTLGKFLDPIADKMLVISVFIALVETGRLSSLVAIVVIIRELTISGIRLLASDRGVVIAANNLGKAKTVSQIIAIIYLLSEPLLSRLTVSLLDERWIVQAGNVIVVISVILTLLSGLNYLRQNIGFISGKENDQ